MSGGDGVFVNLYKRMAFDPVGYALEVEMGDCPVSHGTLEIDGTEWTTGARWGFKGPLYGQVNPDTYQGHRGLYVCRFINPVTPAEKETLIASCQSLAGMPYGFGTIAALMLRKYHGGFIDKLGDTPKLTVNAPICTEAVTYHAWAINRPLCVDLGKLEPRACTPQSLWFAAMLKNVLEVVDEH